MYSGAHRGTGEDRSRQGPSHDTWLEEKNIREGEHLLLFSAEQNSEQGMKFVYILAGFTGECLNRQTAAGLPSQQLINNSAFLSRSFYVCVCMRVCLCVRVRTCVLESRGVAH